MTRNASFVLDCSVVMSWCFEDEVSELSEFAINKLRTATAFVPNIWSLEVMNALLTAVRKKRISYIKALEFKDALTPFHIEVDLINSYIKTEAVFELAHQLQLTSYDASYVELAIRKNLPLATLDEALAKAAKRVGIAMISSRE